MQLTITDVLLTITPEAIDLADETLSTVELQVLFDCCTEVHTESISLPGGDTIALPNTINDDDGKFVDGVYQVKLTATYGDGSIVNEESCIFADTSLKCLVAADLASDPTSITGPLYQALLSGNDCDCNCTNACEVLKHLRKKLGQTPASCSSC